uniref:Uncharacterized protein n=1 Tax=Melanopsichium pennsylvanicum 4 TaxID=1398559 RepID=A0A077R8V1_9BASI|nr:hypothetical protein BN887_06216 [Melanopsichium pennsylvanicum 4]
MLLTTTRRPSLPVSGWLAPDTRQGSSRLAHAPHRTFYSDLYENEGHLFDLNGDEGRPTVSCTPFSSSARPKKQQSSRFSTSNRTAYDVERQMQRLT